MSIILKDSRVRAQDETPSTGITISPESGNIQVYSQLPPLKLCCVVAYYADEICNNKNIYPANEVESGISFYNSLVQIDPTDRYIFINHPVTQWSIRPSLPLR